MNYLVAAVVGVLFLAVLGVGWVRLAPLPVERFSARPGPYSPGTHKMPGGVKYVIPLKLLPDGALDHLTWIALETPRSRLAHQEDDLIAIVTRTRRIGFPDITVAWVADGNLHVHAHLVYGKNDLGQNAARTDRWLDRLALLATETEDDDDPLKVR
ncbi:DUF1499 domain-containing protein [uncultured Aliiroseovarius sp.]|uniref:DUF1499 domain-containing protein n=1 Tax=uncultured Aliiroseovarius sp. TaxID=1658783 RepID=UPI002591CBE5|nr:DUF1499 domain-containing protein [uncultured Aliiroseovarius sp.]